VFFTTKEAGTGTGLGLSICYGIVKERGGSIWVDSPGGSGSIFTVELPLAEVAPVLRRVQASDTGASDSPDSRYQCPMSRRGAMRRLRENLLVRFSVVSFVVMAGIAVALTLILSNKIRSDAIDELVTEDIGESSARLLNAITPADLEAPMTGERYSQFHEFVQRSIVSERTARIKLWAKDGTVIYSSDPAGVGEKFPANESLLKALHGENSIEIKVPKDPENARERHLGTLMEVYTPIIFPGTTEPEGAFELYSYYEPTAQRINSLRTWLFGSIGLGFVALYGSLVSIVWRGSKTISVQQRRLESFNAQLEERIHKRTEELQRSNRDVEIALHKVQTTHEQLIQSAKLAAIGELVSGVAHEINNPLAGISGHTQLLLRRDFDGPVKESLEHIYGESRRVTRIVQNLLSFARQQPPQNLSLSINETVTRTLEMRSYDLGVDSIELVTDLDRGNPAVFGDPQQLQQVFLNIVNNAQQAMVAAHGRGRLEVKSRRVNDNVRITFTDDGPGIPASTIDRVFDPFFTTKEAGKGTGLGLSICYGIVKEHGGNISVESPGSSGSIFTVEVPLAEEAPVPSEEGSKRVIRGPVMVHVEREAIDGAG